MILDQTKGLKCRILCFRWRCQLIVMPCDWLDFTVGWGRLIYMIECNYDQSNALLWRRKGGLSSVGGWIVYTILSLNMGWSMIWCSGESFDGWIRQSIWDGLFWRLLSDFRFRFLFDLLLSWLIGLFMLGFFAVSVGSFVGPWLFFLWLLFTVDTAHSFSMRWL